MASIDLNNSYWAQKLVRFRDGGRLFLSGFNCSVKGMEVIDVAVNGLTSAECGPVIYVAALALLVGKWSSKEGILIAVPRTDTGLESCPLFYGVDIDEVCTVTRFVAHIQDEMELASKHWPYSFETVTEFLHLNPAEPVESLFQIGFSTASTDGGGALPRELIRPNGIHLRLKDIRAAELELLYDTGCFARERMAQFAGQYSRLLTFLSRRQTATLSEFELLDEQQKHRVAVEFNDTSRTWPSDKTLHGLVEDRVARAGRSVAVICRDQELSYDDLNERANRLAHFLRSRLNVRTGDVVGVMLNRSEGLVPALLGVMKAGAAYVPINPKHPWPTISYMVENAGIRVLLVDSESVSKAATFEGELFVVDIELDFLETSISDPGVKMSGSELAYIIYTSGSTGRPKGVAVEHRAIVNTLLWRDEYYGFDQDDVNLQMPSFAFDSSVVDIFSVLISGGRLVITDEELRLDARHLRETIHKYGVTRLLMTPSYYRVLISDMTDCGRLRSITVAGESMPTGLVEEHSLRMPGVALYNEYGPTENAVCSTACLLGPGQSVVSIGKPIDNVRVFVLDKNLGLLPAEVPGEMFLGGAGLARSYFNNEPLTTERFISSPLPQYYEGRLYRSGDWAYWTPNGKLVFLGRLDNQVKVRGFRIELDDVEHHLLSHQGVQSAAIVCKENDGNKYLSAYVVARGPLTSSELRRDLLRRLPYYMVPDVISIVPELPLNLNGKVDRVLLKRAGDSTTEGVFDSPGDEVESGLAAICSAIVQGVRLDPEDNLFDHGLNSLMVMQMVSRIRNELDLEVSLTDIYTFPTIKALSRRIGATRCKQEIMETASLI